MRTLLFVGAVPPPYHGVTVQNEMLLRSELRNQFNVVHVDTSDRRDMRNLGRVDPINVICGLRDLTSLVIALVRFRPDLFYITVAQNRVAFARDGLFVILAKLLGKPKVVLHFRGGNYLNFYGAQGKLYRRFIDFVYSKSDFGIVLGRNLNSMITKWFDPEQILTIPEGADFPARGTPRTRATDGLYIGYIGILHKDKGTEDLLRAFSIIRNCHDNVRLLLAGEFAYDDGTFSRYTFDLVDKLGLSTCVEFLGRIEGKTKEDFYSSVDIFAFPSYMEGHPIGILEAMASGLPIVATNVGAVSESVATGENGFLVEPGDVQALSEKLTELVESEKLRKEMGNRSRYIYTQGFTAQKNINRMLGAFHQVAEGGADRGEWGSVFPRKTE